MKGLPVLEQVARALPDVLFVLIGAGPIDPAAWGLANVVVVPVVEQAALRDWYWAGDALVLPSTGEGFPLSVAEAMVCGCPAIVSPETYAAWADGREHFLVAEPAPTADAVRALLAGPIAAARARGAGRDQRLRDRELGLGPRRALVSRAVRRPARVTAAAHIRDDAMTDGETVLLRDGGWIRYWARFLAATEAERLFAALRDSVPWEQFRNHLWTFPRLTAFVADAGLVYRYSGVTHTGEGWPAGLLAVRRQVERQSGARFNGVLLNLYRDGSDSMGRHADAEPRARPEPARRFGVARRRAPLRAAPPPRGREASPRPGARQPAVDGRHPAAPLAARAAEDQGAGRRAHQPDVPQLHRALTRARARRASAPTRRRSSFAPGLLHRQTRAEGQWRNRSQ